MEQSDEDLRLFWESFGSWQDNRTTEEIIADIYMSRTSTERECQLTDDALVTCAEELFLALDREEAEHHESMKREKL